MQFRALWCLLHELARRIVWSFGWISDNLWRNLAPQLPCIIPQISAIVDQTGCVIQGPWGVLEVLSGVEEEAGDTSRTPRIP